MKVIQDDYPSRLENELNRQKTSQAEGMEPYKYEETLRSHYHRCQERVQLRKMDINH